MSLETMTKLATVTVGVGGSGTITFSNIPQTYTDLKLVYSLRNASNNTTMQLTFNSDGARANYLYRQFYGTGSAVNNDTQSDLFWGNMDPSSYTANTFSNGEIYIPNYLSANQKSVSTDSVIENNATAAVTALLVGRWTGTAAITSIQLSCYIGTFAEFSSVTLYGVKAQRTAVGNSIKATGGAIAFDGTYVTHTFTSTDTFTPTTNLLVDYLVVAGGGGGGKGANAGGGGAGGLRSTVTATGGGGTLESKIFCLGSTSYGVTIGAGGAGGAADTNNGTNGSNSGFASITSTGGGGGGGSGSHAGLAGGSGGGGGLYETVGGAASPAGQGYAGGGNVGLAANFTKFRAGGGGGAGAVGGTGNTNYGNGGIGVATVISGISTYYAGGGGGGSNDGIPFGGAGGGGNTGTPGTINTGGGAGGAGNSNGNNTSSGGSGIVIIRYKG